MATAAHPITSVAEFINPNVVKVITDAQGLATVSFGLADSITTWRVTAHGSTKDGHLGSAQLGPVSYTHLTLPTNREV